MIVVLTLINPDACVVYGAIELRLVDDGEIVRVFGRRGQRYEFAEFPARRIRSIRGVDDA